MNIKLACVFTFCVVFTYSSIASPSLYSGGVKTFSMSNEFLALHEHGITDEGSEYSFLTLFQIKENLYKIIQKSPSPELIALSWSDDGSYLIGISNLYNSKSNHVFVFDQSLSLILSTPWGCTAENHNPLFCSTQISPEQRWLNKILDRFHVYSNGNTIELCTDDFCKKIDLSHDESRK